MPHETLAFTSAAGLGRLIAGRQVSPVEVTELALERIAALNPSLNAFLAVDEEGALAAARDAEQAALRGELRGPLHGVPLSVKDLFWTRGLASTGGSLLYRGFIPAEDSIPVQRLRNAGAVILGKTSTSEFGLSATTENRLVGDTRNPWDTTRTSGGSSGGAAAAVAAGLGPLAIGSDGGGSIRVPASFCGVYGLKPTRGRVPRSGGFGRRAWNPWAQPGPITGTVEDAALALQTMAGWHPRDVNSLREPPPDFLSRLRAGVNGLRVAVSLDLGYAAVEPAVAEAVRAVARVFEGLGARVEEPQVGLGDPFSPFWTVFTANCWASFGEMVEQHRAELGDFTVAFAEEGRRVTGADYSRALSTLDRVSAQIADVFEQHDLLLTPTTPVAAFPLGQRPVRIAGRDVDPLWSFNPFCFVFNITGHPAASLPCGPSPEGLPIGAHLVGRMGDEAMVLRASAAYEAARPWAGRRPYLAL